MKEARSLRDLVELVARLRDPDGCPWDREQTISDVRAYLVEEAHEVAAAIDGGAWEEIRDELGDLLFQAAFIARLGEEAAAFAAEDAIAAVNAKMVERHPHVFGDTQLADSSAVARAWERRKAAQGEGLLSGVPPSLPALTGAYRMTQKAAGVGFDWPDAKAVLAKVEEELAELQTELDDSTQGDESTAEIREELGDLLFAIANLSRHLKLDPEAALAAANAKFRRRFAFIEEGLKDTGRGLEDSDLAEMEQLWAAAKAAEAG